VIKSNVHEAKSRLSQLIELANAGEEVIICKAGKPVVRLIPYSEKKAAKARHLERQGTYSSGF
jgi:prevent-host-death family protein